MRLVAALSIAASLALGPSALGQLRKSTVRTPSSRAPGSARNAADAGTRSPPAAPVATANAGTPPAADRSPTDGGVVEARTLDGGTHVFKFSELDIEGRLKSPQLVYFLRRVRAEFGAEDLGHRSFLREMSETRKESSF